MKALAVDIFKSHILEAVINAGDKREQGSFKNYQSKDIQAIAKVSKMQLIHWSQQGMILPVVDAHGRGKTRTYDYQNLIEAMICRQMNLFSMQGHHLKMVLSQLREIKWDFNFRDRTASLRGLYELKLNGEMLATWPDRMPGAECKEILLSLERDDQEIFIKRVKRIIDRTKEPRKTRIKDWLREREELIVKIEAAKSSDLPGVPRFQRRHTVWEFLRLYPRELFNFYLVTIIENSESGHTFIYDSEGMNIVGEAQTSLVINLQSLVLEAGEIRHEG